MTFPKNIALVFGLLCAFTTARTDADSASDTWFPTTVNNQLGLIRLLELAKADQLAVTIGDGLTPEHFPLKSTKVRNIKLALKRAAQPRERGGDMFDRLTSAGYIFEGVGEMAAFIAQYPQEAAKCKTIHALGSVWMAPNGTPYVPIAWAHGYQRNFQAHPLFRTSLLNSQDCVLVSRP